MELKTELIEHIVNFLNEINITVEEQSLSNDTFLPGLSIDKGVIIIDREKLKYPGDILHEAGHVAVTEEKVRPYIGTKKLEENWPYNEEEIVAILWSYAALHHLKLPPEVVFHPNGYKNDSVWLIEQFSNKNYIGLPLFEWMGFCDEETVFPNLKKWLR